MEGKIKKARFSVAHLQILKERSEGDKSEKIKNPIAPQQKPFPSLEDPSPETAQMWKSLRKTGTSTRGSRGQRT